jgi:predicted nucleic acid-binding protein
MPRVKQAALTRCSSGAARKYLAILMVLLTRRVCAMNGLTDGRSVLDTNWAVDFTDGKMAEFPDGKRFVSVITEMELFAAPFLTPEKEQGRRDFLNDLTIIPLNEKIKQEAIRIRRYGKPRLKLPDAIIAATAVILDATLVTNDNAMLKLSWPGLRTVAAR